MQIGGATVRTGGALPQEHVAIVGGGFSGALLAINLLRHEGPRATLIERRSAPARGTAYSTTEPGHLLNVRAANMSALPDEPRHFLRWLERRHPTAPHDFVPRRLYGAYLGELLDEAVARAGGRLRLVHGDAVAATLGGEGVALALNDGRSIAADRLVLATGNLPPDPPPPLRGATLPAGRYVDDPWAPGALDGIAPDDPVLIVGTGLTMIDVVVLLADRGHRAPITALSRRGLLPHAHAEVPPPQRLEEHPPARALALLGHVRRRARDVDWRVAVDELRPITQTLWRGAPAGERRRFLRHLRAWWDIHRHRIAPAVAARLAAMRADGRLGTVAGGLVAVEAGERGVDVAYRPHGGGAARTLAVARIVNCTGPAGAIARSGEPLLASLLAQGAIRPDPLGLGIEVNEQAEAIGAGGAPDPRLLALGPMTRGAFWEIVAVPDIRRQVWTVARRLANAQWVAGEGL